MLRFYIGALTQRWPCSTPIGRRSSSTSRGCCQNERSIPVTCWQRSIVGTFPELPDSQDFPVFVGGKEMKKATFNPSQSSPVPSLPTRETEAEVKYEGSESAQGVRMALWTAPKVLGLRKRVRYCRSSPVNG